MARPKTDEVTLKAIFEGIQRGEKSKAIAEALGHTVSVSLIADMRNGWAHTELGKSYGIEPKVRKPKVAKAEPEVIEDGSPESLSPVVEDDVVYDPEVGYEFDEELED